MKKNIKVISWIVATLSAVFVLTLGIFSFTLAQNSPPAAAPPVEEEAQIEPFLDISNVCATQVTDFAFQKKRELGEFMNTHFRSSQPTSELIPTAVARYAQYRAQVREYAQGFVPAGGRLASGAVFEPSRCDEAIRDDFDRMKELVRNHVLENAHAKKSTRLLDKYKSINTKLEKLNFTIAQMYGYFGALSQKLPCYATQCVRY